MRPPHPVAVGVRARRLPAAVRAAQAGPVLGGGPCRPSSRMSPSGRLPELQPGRGSGQEHRRKPDRVGEDPLGWVRQEEQRRGPRVPPAQYELPFRVAGKRGLNPRTVELRLAPLARRLPFVPGQYLLLSDPDGQIEPRSYSIANRPRPDGTLTLLVTQVPGGQCSGWVLGTLPAGAEVLVDGPFGDFFPGPEDWDARVYLAGGVGMAPILALLEEALGSPGEADLHLLCSLRSEDDFLGREQVRRLQRRHPRFHVTRTLTRGSGQPPLGRLPPLLPALLGSLAQVSTFVAGPEGFVDSCAAALLSLGADPSRLHTEAFFPTPSPWGPGPP